MSDDSDFEASPPAKCKKITQELLPIPLGKSLLLSPQVQGSTGKPTNSMEKKNILLPKRMNLNFDDYEIFSTSKKYLKRTPSNLMKRKLNSAEKEKILLPKRMNLNFEEYGNLSPRNNNKTKRSTINFKPNSRKTLVNIRKDTPKKSTLFKKPTRTNLKSRFTMPPPAPQRKTFISNDTQPLIDIEEVEEELINKACLKEPLLTNAFHRKTRSKNKSEKDKSDEKLIKTERLDDNNVASELLSLSPLNNCLKSLTLSPVNEKKIGWNQLQNALRNIDANYRKILEENKKINIAIEEYNEKFEIYKKQHDEELNTIATLIEDLKSAKGKENFFDGTPIKTHETQVRKSPRLQLAHATSLPNISPSVPKQQNLRIMTLTKSLSKMQNEDASTPDNRFEKAKQMYNKMKVRFPDLSTPLPNRKLLKTPKTGKEMTNAMKVQKQCLLLQETPMKK